MKKDRSPDYSWDNYFFSNVLISHFFYAKHMFLSSLIWLIFFRFLLYYELLKF